jgi:Na+-transporting methylmalonyl-CoA/oxaloacetate decarboxylase gamma subunit
MVIKMGFDFHVHGLWILGALFFFVAGLMAGNLQWVVGTTEVSFGISVILIFLLFLIAAMFWISAAVNARHDEFMAPTRSSEEVRTEREIVVKEAPKPAEKGNIYINVYRNGKLAKTQAVQRDALRDTSVRV